MEPWHQGIPLITQQCLSLEILFVVLVNYFICQVDINRRKGGLNKGSDDVNSFDSSKNLYPSDSYRRRREIEIATTVYNIDLNLLQVRNHVFLQAAGRLDWISQTQKLLQCRAEYFFFFFYECSIFLFLCDFQAPKGIELSQQAGQD